MASAPTIQSGYSADVQLRLAVGRNVFPLASIGPSDMELREARELPPSDAEIILSVDGNETRWRVYLPNGAVPFETRVDFVNLPPD
jgi:hypothetical protein